jgi:hypothetical protein
MPVSYSIDLERGLVTTLLEGVVTLQDLAAMRALVKADKDFQPHLRSLIDATRMTGFAFNSSDLRRILNSSSLGRDSRRAIIGTPGLGFGLGRMMEILNDERGPKTRVFRDADEAIEWLTGAAPGGSG